MKSRVALKGGTALNLFIFDVPRLSVDIDLNYIGGLERETMMAERPQVEQAVQAVCGRLGLDVARVPYEHAGGKWRLRYQSAFGHRATLELDMNFMLRTPLWPTTAQDSQKVGSFVARAIPVLDVHELAAGKLAALFSRDASRDLFDVWNLSRHKDLDLGMLRLAFVVYGGISRRDWRSISIEDVQVDPMELSRQLVPTLRVGEARQPAGLDQWAANLLAGCRDLCSGLLPLHAHEVDFLDALNDGGEIVPDLLTDDSRLQDVIGAHRGLLWKAQNVRAFRHRA